ncbi:transporter DctQ-related protein [Moorella sp. E308F]|uniref:TRAP transporter small permease subunit n=1 Tax=Moorella sp. E308F TaxID=2572682 RepID=UPI0010FFBDF2|nr:TRAP transporter small permease subunit [Moorella sp. E308F]GEA14747.1 transporter DctQ-related protein [Moorella sp. E308F]
MTGKLAKVLKAIDFLSEKTGKLFSFLILIMVGLETIEVIRRYILHSPTTWAWEVVVLLYGAHFITGGAWVLKEGGHVRTDILFSRFSPKMKAIVDLLLFAIIFFTFVGVMIWKYSLHAIYSWSIKETTYTMWAPPFYPLKTVVAISFILLGLQGLAKWIRDLIFVIKGEEI